MAGPRNWYFTVGGTTIGAETDCFIEYDDSGDTPTRDLIVHASWERSVGADWYAKRRWIEARMSAIGAMVGRTGTLEIDKLLADPSVLAGVTLKSWNRLQYDNNLMLEYELTFGYSIPGQGDILSGRRAAFVKYDNGREPAGTDFTINAAIFSLSEQAEDRTTFKDTFRNAKVRVPNGPGLITGTLTGVKQLIAAQTPDTGIMRRRAVEALCRAQLDNIGKEFDLTIDGNYGSDPSPLVIGRIHLNSFVPSRLDLPDAAVFDINYTRNYVE